MSLGLGIFLLVIGGILAFGVRDQWSAVDLTAIGYVCLVVGALALALSLLIQQQRRKTSHTAVVDRRTDSGNAPPPVV